MDLERTFFGYVGTTNDALLIFEACRGNQLLQKVSRRPHDHERDRLIKSGNIFVFDEQSPGIQRWNDGIVWSPSRILGNYLIYRQLERPFQPGEKKRAQKRPGNLPRNGSQGDLGDSNRMKTELSDDRSPSLRAAGGPILGHKIKTDSSSNRENGSERKSKPWSDEQEKELAGSLTDSYGVKEGGLIKKTMSVEYNGTVHRLVSYFTIEDLILSRLPATSSDPRLADLQIGSDLIRTNSRVRPNSENGHSPGRSSPTQQRAQVMTQHGWRHLEVNERVQDFVGETWEVMMKEEWWRPRYESVDEFKLESGVPESVVKVVAEREANRRMKRTFEELAVRRWGGSDLGTLLGRELMPRKWSKRLLETMKTLARVMPDVDQAIESLKAARDRRLEIPGRSKTVHYRHGMWRR